MAFAVRHDEAFSCLLLLWCDNLTQEFIQQLYRQGSSLPTRYVHFDIKNFKGIEHVELDLSKAPRARVHTLIGLNESGKTTILQAIDRFAYRESLDVLSAPGYTQQDVHELIPISKRASFNDSISIVATVELDPHDMQKIIDLMRKEHEIVITSLSSSFTITQTHKFTSSQLESTGPMTWRLTATGRRPGSKTGPISGDDWQTLAEVTKSFLPRVMYFPNFLFDFPDKIYLHNAPSDQQKHAFYRAVLQDVLDAMGDQANIAQHVLSRANSAKEFDKKILDSILLKMGAHITKTVFGAWDKIFKQPPGTKEIVVSIGKDTFVQKPARRKKASASKNSEVKEAASLKDGSPERPDSPARNAYFLQLRLKEGNTYYEISERSLGFRWFFTYLLLTQYRGFRTEGPRNVVFLLDEPASNLHPSAQAQLLDSFQSLPEGCHIIYTTHSHHLIKPEWLESAFVVKNIGLDYSKEIEHYTSRRTEITVQRYRAFAAQYPNQTTYFQPVLDVLDYAPTRLELVPDVVMVEGKNDFFVLKYMRERLQGVPNLMFLPGSGAGSLDTLIRLYVGWGRNFVIMLDSDNEGAKQHNRYADIFGSLVTGRIFTLGHLNSAWKDRGMERMFTSDEQLAIQQAVFPDTKSVNKTHFARAIQELVITKQPVRLSAATQADFGFLLTTLDRKLMEGRKML